MAAVMARLPNSALDQRRRTQIGYCRIPIDRHQQIGLSEQAPQDVDDSIGPIEGQTPGVGTADRSEAWGQRAAIRLRKSRPRIGRKTSCVFSDAVYFCITASILACMIRAP